jgi:hypothetical protein
MQKIITAFLAIALLICTGLYVAHWVSQRPSAEAQRFMQDSDALLEGLQTYRKFTGGYPTGSAVDIANELSGKSDKKVLVLAAKANTRNAKGEIVDPWGTPVQFFFGSTSALIRSAGPNRKFEDTGTPGSDDLLRTDAR